MPKFSLVAKGCRTANDDAGWTRWVALTASVPLDLETEFYTPELEALFDFVHTVSGADFTSDMHAGPGQYFQQHATIRQMGRRLLVQQRCGYDV